MKTKETSLKKQTGCDIPGVTTFEHTKIIGRENIEFGRPVILDDFVLVYAKARMRIGNYVHIACFASLTGGAPLTIGDFAAVSQGARVLTGTDDFKAWGFGNSTVEERYRNATRAPVSIGRFCIVGANSVVLPGVSIGEGATVGAGSVVTRDLAPWGVYIGNKRIRDRDKRAVLDNYERFQEDHPNLELTGP
jgi:acetyltransferase-like isoleucine patch superfamily enzyme